MRQTGKISFRLFLVNLNFFMFITTRSRSARPPSLFVEAAALSPEIVFRGVIRNLSRGGLNFFLFPGGGAQHLLGPENPLKSKYFTGPGGGLAPIALP